MRAECLVSASVGVLAVALAGCSTTSMVQSVAVADDKPQPKAAEVSKGNKDYGPSYLTYYLPQTVLSVKLTAKKAGGGDDAKDDKATTSSSATVTNTVTITAAKAEEKTDKGDGGGDAKSSPMAICDQIKARYDYLQGAHAALTVSRLKDIDALNTQALGPLKSAQQQADMTKAIDAFRLKSQMDDERVATAWAIARTFVKHACPAPLNVELTVLSLPDTSHAYRLHMKDNSGSADSFTIKLDANGMLSSVSTTADDKTADVVTGAVKSLATVVGALDPSGVVTVKAQNTSDLAKANPSYVEHIQIPGLKSTGPAPEKAFRAARLNEIRAYAQLEPVELPMLAPRLPNGPILLNLDTLGVDQQSPPPVELGDTALFAKAVCTTLPGKPSKPNEADADGEKEAVGAGLVVSTPRACRLSVASGRYDFDDEKGLVAAPAGATFDPKTDQTWAIAALDSARPMPAPLMRTRLVKRVQGYEFKDGAVTQVTYDKPSDGAAAVAVPGNLIGGLFSGISAGIQGRQGNYKDQAALLDAKASVLDSQAALIKAQADLEAAKNPKATTTDSSSK